jgi:hypothetical protein
MAEGELRHEQLIYRRSEDEVRITQPTDPGFSAQVRIISARFARMTIKGMNGYIELSRNG